MANPTNPFNWQMPTATDLVTDLPADFETFGQAVATSMADLLGGTSGQVLSKASNTDMDFTWVTTDDANAIQNSIVDAKGDLIAASANDTPARLAVGANGETLVADSSTSTGLRYQGNYAAGKNKIINGDMGVWQRGTSINCVNGNETYTADRFVTTWSGTGTTTATRETFTPGTAPVAGYEGSFFHRTTMGTGATYFYNAQKIEDVRTFAGQTITVSFWAKASSSVVIRPIFRQFFGSGGSGNVDKNGADITLTTSWVRYSFTVTLDSIAGKTIGTNSSLTIYGLNYQSGTVASNVIDTWGWQVEASNTATAFQTATGTIQGESSACMRYYEKRLVGGANYGLGVSGACNSTTVAACQVTFATPKRTNPSVSFGGNLAVLGGSINQSVTALNGAYAAGTASGGYIGGGIDASVASGLTVGSAVWLRDNGAGTAYIEFSSEL